MADLRILPSNAIAALAEMSINPNPCFLSHQVTRLAAPFGNFDFIVLRNYSGQIEYFVIPNQRLSKPPPKGGFDLRILMSEPKNWQSGYCIYHVDGKMLPYDEYPPQTTEPGVQHLAVRGYQVAQRPTTFELYWRR